MEQLKETRDFTNEVLQTIDTASELIVYCGSRNDGELFQDDYFLAVLNELREAKSYISSLTDEVEELRAKEKANAA